MRVVVKGRCVRWYEHGWRFWKNSGWWCRDCCRPIGDRRTHERVVHTPVYRRR